MLTYTHRAGRAGGPGRAPGNVGGDPGAVRGPGPVAGSIVTTPLLCSRHRLAPSRCGPSIMARIVLVREAPRIGTGWIAYRRASPRTSRPGEDPQRGIPEEVGGLDAEGHP